MSPNNHNRTDVITLIEESYNAEGPTWKQDHVLVSESHLYLYYSYCSFTNNENKFLFYFIFVSSKKDLGEIC